jgi:predicted Zn finger-like uncharacterized protein
MIIACPSCGKKYRLADDAIPETGRRVRCVACGHAWHQDAPAPPPPPPPPPEPEPVPEPVAAPIWTPSATPEPERPSTRGAWAATIVFVLLVLAALALTAPGGLRGFDPLARVEPVQPGSALVLKLDEPIWGEVLDGSSVLTLTGRLTNPTRQPLDVPPLAAEVRSADGQLLAQWLSPPPALTLAPGGEAAFDTAGVDVPEGAATVRLSFATRPKTSGAPVASAS